MPANSPSNQQKTAIEKLVPVAGGALFCQLEGQGMPILLLHGWPLDHRVWQPQVEHLRDHHKVIALDRRGFGRSTGSADGGDAVGDVDSVLDACEVESAVIIGMSRGGRIALRYAHERPERVRGLVLVGTAVDGFDPPADPAEDIPIEQYAALARAGDLEGLRAAWRSHPLMALHGVSEDISRLIDEVLADYKGQDLLPSVARQKLPPPPPPNVAAHLDRIHVPVLIVVGEFETAARKSIAAHLAGGLPNAESMVIANGGHLLNLEQPEEFNAAVDRFLRRHGLDN
jgi:pimeloyl-ACP methyl ester carboxylesterase